MRKVMLIAITGLVVTACGQGGGRTAADPATVILQCEISSRTNFLSRTDSRQRRSTFKIDLLAKKIWVWDADARVFKAWSDFEPSEGQQEEVEVTPSRIVWRKSLTNADGSSYNNTTFDRTSGAYDARQVIVLPDTQMEDISRGNCIKVKAPSTETVF